MIKTHIEFGFKKIPVADFIQDIGLRAYKLIRDDESKDIHEAMADSIAALMRENKLFFDSDQARDVAMYNYVESEQQTFAAIYGILNSWKQQRRR